MNNGSEDMRSQFLIIGFTGPLRSGVTTAANYLRYNLRASIEAEIRSTSKYQVEINNLYKDIFKQNKPADAEYSKLWDMRKELISKIQKRNISLSLTDFKKDHPHYISMTDMLFKTAIEFWWNERKSPPIKTLNAEDRENCELILENINKSKIKNYIKDIDDINNIIRMRKYHELDEPNKKRINLYNKYLADISILRDTAVKSFTDRFKEYGAYRYAKILQDMGDNIRRSGNPFSFETSEYKRNCLYKLSEQANDEYRERHGQIAIFF